MGGPGWQITATIIVSIGIYFYLPPEGAGLQAQVSEEIFSSAKTWENDRIDKSKASIKLRFV